MAYNFLNLVNDVCGRVNETPLTSSNFGSAGGFYATAKEAVNSSIRFINQDAFEWPFNHVREELTLVPGTLRYSFPADAKSIDLETFHIARDNSLGNGTVHLSKIDYEEYLEKLIDAEYNTDTSIRQTPRVVFKSTSEQFGVYPSPDKDYKLVYEYYQLPVDLEAHDDSPSVPGGFKHIIVDGAMYYVYFFRGDIETADRLWKKFEDGIKNMRTIYINRYDKIRDTRILRPVTTSAVNI